MISQENIFNKVSDANYGGFMNPKLEKSLNTKFTKFSDRKSKLTEDEYIVMKQYAQYLPHGYQRLKLDIPELRQTLIETDLKKAPLTKTAGLNSGGNLSLLGGRPKTQKEYLVSIMNKNKLASNPNPTSFKNNIKF
ncbi:MAG: hypothetical protein ACI9YE_000450 [Psychroserpens sp.]|jgi:hypothetical protein